VGTTIKDEGIPELLLRQKKPTFITLNVLDFWLKFEPHPRFCIVCCPLPTQRQGELPALLLAFLKHGVFRTAAQRMGKIIRLTEVAIAYYEHANRRVQRVGWLDS